MVFYVAFSFFSYYYCVIFICMVISEATSSKVIISSVISLFNKICLFNSCNITDGSLERISEVMCNMKPF